MVKKNGENCAFSVLTLLVGRQEEHPVCKKFELWGADVVICLEQVQMICIWSSWCHCHPVISCFIKIQIGLTLKETENLSGLAKLWQKYSGVFLTHRGQWPIFVSPCCIIWTDWCGVCECTHHLCNSLMMAWLALPEVPARYAVNSVSIEIGFTYP